MSTGTFSLWLTTDAGVRIQSLNDILSFSATRQVNAIGPFVGKLKSTFDISLLKRDRMIQVWYAPPGGRLSLWRVYFLRKWRFETKGSNESIQVWGRDPNYLLYRRIVAAYSASTYATKNDVADDMMKEIVTESLSDNLLPAPDAGTRAWSNLSVAGDVSAGPTLSRSIAWKELLTNSGSGVLPNIAQAAREAGTEVFFDIVADTISANSITFQFRTYTGQPGQDVSDRVVFDQNRGNLQDPFYEFDAIDEVNYVYAGGGMVGVLRNIQQVYDADRYNASIWNRCEGFADARGQASDDEVREAGRAVLEEGRPKERLGGTPVDTKGTRFGRDWNFGDKVKAKYKELEFDTIIRAVTIGKEETGRHFVLARLDYEA